MSYRDQVICQPDQSWFSFDWGTPLWESIEIYEILDNGGRRKRANREENGQIIVQRDDYPNIRENVVWLEISERNPNYHRIDTVSLLVNWLPDPPADPVFRVRSDGQTEILLETIPFLNHYQVQVLDTWKMDTLLTAISQESIYTLPQSLENGLYQYTVELVNRCGAGSSVSNAFRILENSSTQRGETVGFPNPASETFTVYFPEPFASTEVIDFRIVDNLGRVVSRQIKQSGDPAGIELSVGGLPQGWYQVHWLAKSDFGSLRFMKE